MEIYMTPSGLLPELYWHEFVDKLKEDIKEVSPEKVSLLYDELTDAIVTAVLTRAQISLDEGNKIGVFFSGGVDSTTIAWILKENNIPFTCYTAGFQDEGTKEPEDITESKKAAKTLGFEQKIVLITKEEAEELFKKTARIIGQRLINPITIGVGAVIVAAADLATKDNCTVLFGGLGSEELFAGYQRHDQANKNAEKLQEECWYGLKHMWARDLERDAALGEGFGIVVHTPLLDESVIKKAMKMPASEKIKNHKNEKNCKKYCFRIISEKLGLQPEFAWRPKRAAQYGSRLDSALEKLAKKKGLGKKEYCEGLIG